jgi:hypothetical protein
MAWRWAAHSPVWLVAVLTGASLVTASVSAPLLNGAHYDRAVEFYDVLTRRVGKPTGAWLHTGVGCGSGG